MTARIDAPRLNVVGMTFFTQLILNIKGLNRAHLCIQLTSVEDKLTDTILNGRSTALYLETLCRGLGWQIFSTFLSHLPVERLDIDEGLQQPDWHGVQIPQISPDLLHP